MITPEMEMEMEMEKEKEKETEMDPAAASKRGIISPCRTDP